ncbi:conserved hypothetical protein [Maribacter litoralis]|uniref:Uncharacterized protein n=1 Tax=Maribacter litoralis TaxID=2059726 RepID=A0A653Y5E3_9FLAO|nr:conserved hypothetical protein [Maribacter litoralis]
MHLVDKYMYFIYAPVKKNQIFDEMHNNNNATTLRRGVEKKTIQPKTNMK